MILIDIFIPPIDKVYDFEIDDRIDGNSLIEQVIGILKAKYKYSFSSEKRELFIYRTGEFIDSSMPVNHQGIINGERLILV